MGAFESYWWLSILVLAALAIVLYSNRGLGLSSRIPAVPPEGSPDAEGGSAPRAMRLADPAPMARRPGSIAESQRRPSGPSEAG